jgi:hypothetical protein
LDVVQCEGLQLRSKDLREMLMCERKEREESHEGKA